MIVKKESKEGGEKQAKTKIPKLIRLPQEVVEQLAEAAAGANVSESVYVMQVLQGHFKRRSA